MIVPKGEYIYQQMYLNGSSLSGGALLIAKSETPDMSNYVFDNDILPYLWKTDWKNAFATQSFVNPLLLPPMRSKRKSKRL